MMEFTRECYKLWLLVGAAVVAVIGSGSSRKKILKNLFFLTKKSGKFPMNFEVLEGKMILISLLWETRG